ncbi:hypothetical protein [Nocardioides conyzicola]|uniref:Fibronectin type-III domain-containing protein n=1 Tax=Nocardioides conyzicola TaxID=1651781 RepID=A0ABP8X0D5_9ACTN
MKRTAVTVAAGLVLSLVVVLPTGSASGAPTWVDPADLPDVEGVTQLHVRGASLLWVDAASGDILSAARSADGTWTEPTVRADPASDAVIDDTGRYGPDAYTVGDQLFVLDADGPRPLGDAVPGVAHGSGQGVVWAEPVEGGQRLVSSEDPSAHRVVVPTADVTYLDLVATESELREGGVTQFFVWISRAPGGTPRAWASRGRTGEAPVALSAAGATASSLGTNEDGLVTWTEEGTDGPAVVRVGDADADTGKWHVRTVSTGTGDAAQPVVGWAHEPGAANRFVTWREQRGDTWVVLRATESERNGPWSAPVTVASGPGVLAARQFAARDDAVAIWCRPAAAGCTMQARTTGPTLGPVATLGTVEDAAAASIVAPSDAFAWLDGTPGVRIAALDAEAPRSMYSVVPAAAFSGTAIARWSAPLDNWSAVPSYRFRISDRGPRSFSGLEDWDTPVKPTTATTSKLTVEPGHTRCLGVQGVDAVGNHESAGRLFAGNGSCVTAPLDERELERSKGWTKVWDRDSHNHTLLRTRKAGATLTFERYSLQRMLLLVKRVPNGGTVVVRLNGHSIGTIDTSGPVRRRTAYLAKKLLASGDLKARTLTITVVSRGKPVLVDGVLLADHIQKASEVNRLTSP